MKYMKKHIHWVLRLYLAYVFFKHGYPKLGVDVRDMGFIGYLVGPFEFFGALFILIGPFVTGAITRIGAGMIVVIMIGAIYFHLYIFEPPQTLKMVTWQILLLLVSLSYLIKGNDS